MADDVPQTAATWSPQDRLDDIAGAAAVLDRTAQKRWPGEYGGLWIDGRVIWLAFAVDPEAKIAALRREISHPHDMRGVLRTMPLRELLALQQRMRQERSALQNGSRPTGLPDAIVRTEGLYDLDVDVRRACVVVYLPDPT